MLPAGKRREEVICLLPVCKVVKPDHAFRDIFRGVEKGEKERLVRTELWSKDART